MKKTVVDWDRLKILATREIIKCNWGEMIRPPTEMVDNFHEESTERLRRLKVIQEVEVQTGAIYIPSAVKSEAGQSWSEKSEVWL